MDNDENLIIPLNNSPLAKSTAVLPQTDQICTDSEEFYDIAVTPLSDSIKGEVKDLMTSSKVKYSIFDILICIGIIAVLCAAFCYFMKTTIKEDNILPPFTDSTIRDAVIPDKNTPAGEILEQMKKHSEGKAYNNCLKVITFEELKKKITSDEFREYKHILRYWLEAAYYVNSTDQKKNQYVAQALELSAAAGKIDGQSAAWILSYILFNNYDIIHNDTFKNINTYKKDFAAKDKLKKQILYMQSITTDTYSESDKLKFDLYLCKIYIAYWLHCLPYTGRYNKQLLDDQWDNGVREREKAYEIALKYQHNTEFLNLRKFIVLKIRNIDGKTTIYYFRGKKYISKKHLDNELTIINQRLQQIKSASR